MHVWLQFYCVWVCVSVYHCAIPINNTHPCPVISSFHFLFAFSARGSDRQTNQRRQFGVHPTIKSRGGLFQVYTWGKMKPKIAKKKKKENNTKKEIEEKV